MKYLEGLEANGNEDIIIINENNADNIEAIKSPKDIFNLMTNVKTLNEKGKMVQMPLDENKIIAKNEVQIINRREVKEEIKIDQIVNQSKKKKDVINTDLNFNTKKKEESDQANVKRSIFFDEEKNFN